VSKDPALRNQGRFSLLEVGVGAGANLQFYPKNCVLTVVDPNPYFEDYFNKHRSKFEHINMDKFIIAYGEDMKEIKNNSIDVVVLTLVLCSVKQVRQVLKEIKRVLVPGGKFYFWEHVADQRGTTMRRNQDLLNYIWPFIFDGCEVNRDLGKMIRDAGFSSCKVEPFYVNCAPDSPLSQRVMFNHIIGSHMRGIAVK
jgi:ubiquinone/menaquinone biosynthesis C-methylase UbiE